MDFRDRLSDAINRSDNVLRELRKKPWLEVDATASRAVRGRRPNKRDVDRSLLIKNRDLYKTFETLLPDTLSRTRNVAIVGPQWGCVTGLLENSKNVTWFCTGVSGTIQGVHQLKKRYPRTLTVEFKSLFDTVGGGGGGGGGDGVDGTSASAGSYDLVVVDVNTPHRTELVANLASPLFRSVLRRASGLANLVVIGRVPLLPDPTSLVSSAWVALAQLGIVSHRLRSRTPDEFNWAVAFSATDAAPSGSSRRLFRDLETLWKLVRARRLPRNPCLSGNRNPETEDVFRRATDVLSTESDRFQSVSDSLQTLAKGAWAPAMTNAWRARERPYTPSVHSAISRQHGMLAPEHVTERAYETGAQEPRPACHWGQLKLLVSEMEFLAVCREKGVCKGATVVYVGAAPGEHTTLLVDAFPEVARWILIDPSPISVNHPKAERVVSFATDGTVVALKARLGGSAVIYINDMRTETAETTVSAEMINQARWGVHLRAKAMLLKFRMPYPQADGSNTPLAASKTDLAITRSDRTVLLDVPKSPTISRKCLQVGEKLNGDASVLYLEGDVQPQVFAPSNSTETRLMVFPTPAGKYKMGRWDVRSYDSCMYDYNYGLRMRQDGYNLVADLPVPSRRGIDDGYESVRALSAFRMVHGPGNYYRKAVDAIGFLERATGKKFEECAILTATKKTSAKDEKDEYWELFEMWKALWEIRVRDHKMFVGKSDQDR